MRVMAIDASRRQGVVSRSVEIAARSAESAGAQVERVRLSSLEVRTCTGCSMCHLTGTCKIEDDLPALAARMEEADAIILGTDSYFRHSNESTSALLDRLAGYIHAEKWATTSPRPWAVTRAASTASEDDQARCHHHGLRDA